MGRIYLISLIVVLLGGCKNPSGNFALKQSEELGNDKPQVVFSYTRDSIDWLEKVVYPGYETNVPFYHYYHKADIMAPYVILLHGLGGSKEDWTNPSNDYESRLNMIRDSLFRAGFNIAIPDARFHGERSYELGFRPASGLPQTISKNKEDAITFTKTFSDTGEDMIMLMDYLEDRFSEQSLRFNLLGYSMGGVVSLLVNAKDNRLTTVVACVPPVNRPALDLEEAPFKNEIRDKIEAVTPHFWREQQNSPILILAGREDFFYTEKELQIFLEDAPVEKKELKMFDAGHDLPQEYIHDALDWIFKMNGLGS